jgi:hypothetical protein
MKPIRRTQLIAPWGVGAIVNFPDDESLMTCGLDVWPYPTGPALAEFQVSEERLRDRVAVDHFRLPPDYRIPGPGVRNPVREIPFVRFPLWHYCPNCGAMKKLGLFGDREKCPAPKYDRGLTCFGRTNWQLPWLLPVRFIAACPEGHIQDFPFMEWVHRKALPTSTCSLRLRAGRSSSLLSGILIQCSCGQEQTMTGAFNDDALDNIQKCLGGRPWLGEMPAPPGTCGSPLRVLQRGGANVYTPHVMSSIYLPPASVQGTREVVEALEDSRVWRFLSQGLIEGRVDPTRCEGIATTWLLDAAELERAANDKLAGTATAEATHGQSEEEYRQAEYKVLSQGGGNDRVDLFAVPRRLTDYAEIVQHYFQKVVLVHKLRETRTLVGFSRILPEDGRDFDTRKRDLARDSQINWLPAIVVRGEGIFLELRPDVLEHWLGDKENSDLQRRVSLLAGPYNQRRAERRQKKRTILPRFVLLHTLAHLLINQLSYDCGYGSSSLRERLYCQQEHGLAMNGLLIYTASGDSEGTCGGLVRQGHPGRLETTLVRALRKARWCSTDPICMDSRGQGPDSCNLAACHCCALLPETSCEEQNRLLDRAVVVGTPSNPSLGFFSGWETRAAG